jgi:predicted secreted Zn-dependent protease
LQIIRRVALGLALFGFSIHPASAAATSQTIYSYFPVSGSSLAQLYSSMLHTGPVSNGTRGLGATSVQRGADMSLNHCKRFGTYPLAMLFVVRLPALTGGRQLSPSEKAVWTRFVSFVKNHELGHRAIWLSEAAKLQKELDIRKLGSCEAANAKAQMIWSRLMSASLPRHAAFDAAQRGKLTALQFFRFANR